MPARLPQASRDGILADLAASVLTRRQIALRHGASTAGVSHIAKANGFAVQGRRKPPQVKRGQRFGRRVVTQPQVRRPEPGTGALRSYVELQCRSCKKISYASASAVVGSKDCRCAADKAFGARARSTEGLAQLAQARRSPQREENHR